MKEETVGVENLETGKKLIPKTGPEGGTEKKFQGWRLGHVSLSAAAQYTHKKLTGVLVMVRK